MSRNSATKFNPINIKAGLLQLMSTQREANTQGDKSGMCTLMNFWNMQPLKKVDCIFLLFTSIFKFIRKCCIIIATV